MTFSLRARTVFPVDRPPILGGVVTVDGEQIVAVERAPAAGARWRDLGDVALVPGFVNAHTHLEFSHLRAPLGRPGMRLIDWLPLAIAERQNRGHAVAESLAAGLAESAAAGTCALGEISTAERTAYPSDHPAELIMLLEVIGFSRARATSALAGLEERFAAAIAGIGDLQRVGVSPHAPYTISPSLLRMLVLFASRQQVPVAMHLAESKEELQLLESSSGPFQQLLAERSMWDPTAIPPGTRPLEYLRLLVEAPRALVIHGNYLDHSEYAFLADHAERMTLVHCPRTHGYFDHPPFPLATLMAGGVRVALGTDSRASNPDLSMLGEMRQIARSHRGVSPESILELATLAGAQALGRSETLGSIAPGKQANLVALPMQGNSLDEALGGEVEPAAIWLRGREVLRGDHYGAKN